MREAWQETVIQSLEELSDRSRQRTFWVDRARGDFPSPAEVLCELFDDTGLSEMLALGTVFSEEADASLRSLSEKADSITLDKAPDDLLEDSEWFELTQLASRARILVVGALDRQSSRRG